MTRLARLCIWLNIAVVIWRNGPFYSYLSYHPKYDQFPNVAYVAWTHSLIILACVISCYFAFKSYELAIKLMLTLVSVLASWGIFYWWNELYGFVHFEGYLDYWGPEGSNWFFPFQYFSFGPLIVVWLLFNHYFIDKPILRGGRPGASAGR